MNTETIFRIILPLLMVTFVAHRGYYVRKHGSEQDTLKKREEGPVTKLAGLLGIMGFISLLAYVMNPGWLSWVSPPSALVTLGGHWPGRLGLRFASMGPKYPWQKLERYAAHDEGTDTDYNWTLSIYQASHLHCIPPYHELNPADLGQLAHWALVDWDDCP